MIGIHFASLNRHIIVLRELEKRPDIVLGGVINVPIKFNKLNKFLTSQTKDSLKVLFDYLFHKHCEVSDAIVDRIKVELVSGIVMIIEKQIL